jgi:peptide/nickel transport system substrate-binding protein
MKKKIVWLVVSCLMVLSLMIASCAPKQEAKTEEVGQVTVVKAGEEAVTTPTAPTAAEENMVKLTLTKLDGTVVEKMAEKPKYGGTINLIAFGGTSGNFDPFQGGSQTPQSETLLFDDWTRGAAGTGENDMLYSAGGRFELMTGWLAESWELPDAETIIFHIRHGVHWWNKPPANGREFTADDVVWSINKTFDATLGYFASYKPAGQVPTSVKALDKYTVELKVRPEHRGMLLLEIGGYMSMYPSDVIAAGLDMRDWRNCLTTGPWMLTDFVPAVSNTYTRNPNYWQHDPLFPENQLPYADKQHCLVIVDASTREAAFRTGKIDTLCPPGARDMYWDSFKMFKDQIPSLQYVMRYTDSTFMPCGKVDDPNLPFHDLRVRQAMNLAINREEIIKGYYLGHADILGYPVKNGAVFAPYYVPLDQMPTEPMVEGSECSVQELFTYNPEKARQLLKEAGYPDGFKTQIICDNTAFGVDASGPDFMLLIREYLLKVGIDMEVKPMDYSQFMTMAGKRTFPEMAVGIGKTSHPYSMVNVRPEQTAWDRSGWGSPVTDAAWKEISANLGVNDAEVARIIRETTPYILENAWAIWVPIPHSFVVWWPWLKNFHGEFDPGYNMQYKQFFFSWIDVALKKSMGYE